MAATSSYSISKRFTGFGSDELQIWCGTPASGRLVAKVAGLNAGAAGTYTHSVPSSDATLSALNLNLADTTAVAISPAFASATTAYTASVFADRVKVSPTPNDADASYVVRVGDDAFDDGPRAAGRRRQRRDRGGHRRRRRDHQDLHRHRDPPGGGLVRDGHGGQQQQFGAATC